MNNTLTWEHHLYGNQDNKGLIDKLSLRAGLITKLSRIMPSDRLKIMAEGIFFSVLNYGIELYANTWSVMTHDEHLRNSTAYTKEDNRKLQVLVNKVLRSLTGLTFDTSTKLLHIRSNQLSVHQRCAYFSLVSIFKTLKRGQPHYHKSRFSQRSDHQIETRNRASFNIDYRLSISRCSFFYRSSKLFKLLPDDIVMIDKIEHFKSKVKDWVQKNVSLAPL